MFNPKRAPGGGLFYLRMVESAAHSLAVKTTATAINDAAEIERAFVAFARERIDGLLVLPDVTTVTYRELIVSLAAQHQLPAIYAFRVFATSGGLISYGIDLVDLHRRGASYVDRILRGAIPKDLPVQGPTKFELVLNLRTAKTLGLKIPQSILLRADETIH
jgi:putative ABC transport system substrate-binding protein